MSRLKVATILGTRPEIIRLSRVIARLERYADHSLIHTGQHWDYELNEVFFSDLGLRKPDVFLESGGGSLGETLGNILAGSERALRELRPDAVLILGDTNSAISAIMARRLKIPIYHMEAGNRCFDRNVPEETNRKLVDHVADFNLVYTEHARRHLLSEGLPHRRIYLTGSPMAEVLAHYRPQIEASDILSRLGLTDGGFLLAVLHREENVEPKGRLRGLVEGLNSLAERHDCPVIVSAHPRTRARTEALEGIAPSDRVQYMKPMGFHDYNRLQIAARCTISDSGTIAEESAILDFAGVTPRMAIERPEALDTGSVIQCLPEPEPILAAVDAAIAARAERRAEGRGPEVPEDYKVANTAERVVNLILSTARVSNAWEGIRHHDEH